MSSGDGSKEKKRKRKARMTLPKTKDDLQAVIKEVEERTAHEHEHHHHHHHHGGELDELLIVLELLVDSLNASIETLKSRVSRNSMDIARLYKVVGLLVLALAARSEEEKKRHLEEALRVLGAVAEERAAAQAG